MRGELIKRAHLERESRNPLDEAGQPLIIGDEDVREPRGYSVVNVTNILRSRSFALECLRVEK